MEYKASLDTTAIVITLLVPIIGIFGGLIVVIPILLLMIGTYLYSVNGYILTDKLLIIKRPFSKLNKAIMLKDIKYAREGTNEDFKGGIRLFANGGFFGFYGLCTSNNLGRYQLYGTQLKNKLILFMKNEEIVVLTPDDITMMDAINRGINES